MFKAFRWKPAYRQLTVVAASSQFNLWRGMHSRTKKAMEFIAKGYSALQEVDRVIDYCELNDKRLIPLLRQSSILSWLSKLTTRTLMLDIGFPKCISNTISALVQIKLLEAAEMGNPDAQYALGCRLRAENPYAQSEQQAFYYLEKAVDQLHPGALYLLGAVYLTGDCVNQDVSSAIWCFHRASEKGHAGAAIAYGSLLLAGVKLPESVTKFNMKKNLRKDSESNEYSSVEMARAQFETAANAGCDLGLKWLKLLDDEEKQKQKSLSSS